MWHKSHKKLTTRDNIRPDSANLSVFLHDWVAAGSSSFLACSSAEVTGFFWLSVVPFDDVACPSCTESFLEASGVFLDGLACPSCSGTFPGVSFGGSASGRSRIPVLVGSILLVRCCFPCCVPFFGRRFLSLPSGLSLAYSVNNSVNDSQTHSVSRRGSPNKIESNLPVREGP